MTPLQRNAFFRLVNKAWCKAGTGTDREAWRRAEMLQATGVDSTARIDRRARYETVMLHFAILAQDFAAVAYWSTASERRLRWVLSAIEADLSFLKSKGIGDAYMEGIYHQAGHPIYAKIADVPAEHLYLIIQIADSHVRKLRRAAHLDPADLPSAGAPWHIRGHAATVFADGPRKIA